MFRQLEEGGKGGRKAGRGSSDEGKGGWEQMALIAVY